METTLAVSRERFLPRNSFAVHTVLARSELAAMLFPNVFLQRPSI